MTPPPRDTDPRFPVNANEAAYGAVAAELAEVQGVINVAEGRAVALVARALELGVSGGDNLTPRQWVAWKTGVTAGRADAIVRVAERSAELPCTVAALEAGRLSLDQAGEIARFVPARYDESAARVAECCTVTQLRKTLPWYRDPKPDDDKAKRDERSVSSHFDERGYHLHARDLTEAEGAVIDQGLKSMLEDLRRQARADAPDGTDPQPVYAADALVALAETALRSGEAARPGTERYLVHVHLEAGPHGIQLMTHLGIPLPDSERRHLLCDARMRATFHDAATGAPLNVGRLTRVINRRMRRAIEHRDRGCCSVPGCGRTAGLEIHHITHWEDGGATDTANLITLCRFHHKAHHNGTLGIEGNADLARHQEPGVVFTNTWGRQLDPTGTPVPPAFADDTPERGRAQHAARSIGLATPTYQGPTGEKLDRWGFHIQSATPDPFDTTNHTRSHHDDDLDDGDLDPPPEITGHRPPAASPPPTGPASDTPADPTRAGPDAA